MAETTESKIASAAQAEGGTNKHCSLPRGTKFGRYVVIELLGAGGMGAVYDAYDPALNRGVALKILRVAHTDGDEANRAKARLVREAQALGQLSHPNVVAVHDVGTVGDDVFVTMVAVEGETLEEWMKERRIWREVLDVMIPAGRGLAAAHEAGIVHRDFKPSNVMVGKDGNVKVLDFGLARGVDNSQPQGDVSQETSNTGEAKGHDSVSSDLLHAPLTRAGSVVGTPLYMSPEQHMNMAVDERSDQFAFSLVLFEALYGKRPFAARTRTELKRKILENEIPPPQADANVPDWLREIVVRGLALKPGERHPSMDLLLDKLVNNPEEELQRRYLARKVRVIALSVSSVLLVVVGAVFALRAQQEAQIRARCEAEANTMDAVWDGSTGDNVAKAFATLDVYYATDTWNRARPHVDSYVEEWKAARRKICLEGELEKTRSADLLVRSRRCLDEQRARLESLASQWLSPTKTLIERAANSAQSFPLLRVCVERSELTRRQALPTEPMMVRAVEAIRKQLIQADAFVATGQYEKSLAVAAEAFSDAGKLGQVESVVAARLAVASAQQELGRYRKARELLETAYHEAEEIGDDMRALKSASRLTALVGEDLAEHTEAKTWHSLAAAKVQRLGLEADDPSIAAMSRSIASVHDACGEYDRAEEMNQRALAVWKKSLGPEHPTVAGAYQGLGIGYFERGEYEQAAKMYMRSLQIMERALGPSHPTVGASLNNIGNVYEEIGDYVRAEDMYQRALVILERALGSNHPLVAFPLNGLGLVYLAKEDYERARRTYGRVLALLEGSLGADHPKVAAALTNLGSVYTGLGDYEQAFEACQRALTIRTRSLGPKHPDVASPLYQLGNAHLRKGDYGQAEEMYHRALAIWENSLGAKHPFVAEPLVKLGALWLTTGRLAAAREALKRAVDICEQACDTGVHGSALFELAKVLVATTGEKGRAVELALKAKRVFGEVPMKEKLAKVERWLKAHGKLPLHPP